jgi:hypothetical protein
VTGNAAALRRLAVLEASRAAISASTNVRRISSGVQRWVLATCKTSAALRRTVANFNRRSAASRSAASGATDAGVAVFTVPVPVAVMRRSRRRWCR